MTLQRFCYLVKIAIFSAFALAAFSLMVSCAAKKPPEPEIRSELEISCFAKQTLLLLVVFTDRDTQTQFATEMCAAQGMSPGCEIEDSTVDRFLKATFDECMKAGK